MSANDSPVVDLLVEMTADSLNACELEARELILARLSALIAMDAPPVSYLLNLGVASELGIDEDDIRGVFAAVAPIVGTAHIASAAGNVAQAFGFAMELEEYAEAASRQDD